MMPIESPLVVSYLPSIVFNIVSRTVFNEDKILIKNLYQSKEYKATKLMDEFRNKWWTNSSLNRLLKKSSETSAESTDSQIAADHELPALKKRLT